MHLPKNEGGNFEQTPAGTFIARCHRFIDLGSHEQTYQGENKGLKRLVMIGFELPTETMEDGRPFTIHKRYTWSTHEKANMRKDLESWRGAKFNDHDFGPDGFDVRNLLGVPATLTIVHSENDGKNYSNIASIGKAMKGITIPDQINASVYLSLEADGFDREVFEGLSDKLKAFIAESPEYGRLFGAKSKSNGYADQSAGTQRQRELESSEERDFAPLDDMDTEIPF